jgi:hypothetical protein
MSACHAEGHGFESRTHRNVSLGNPLALNEKTLKPPHQGVKLGPLGYGLSFYPVTIEKRVRVPYGPQEYTRDVA